MMNELLFLLQTLSIFAFTYAALKIGKEALVALISLQAVIANLFVLKQIVLFGFHVTASDVFAIGSLLGLNFLQEYFETEEAKKAAWVCFFLMFFFTIVSQMHLLYDPSPYDVSQQAFQTVLSSSPRLFIASMGVFFIVQQIDICFFGFMKRKLSSLSFAFRTGIALVVSQLIDTLLFSFFGLYGLVTSIFDVIVVSFLIKLIVIFFSSICLGGFLKLRSNDLCVKHPDHNFNKLS